MNCKGLFSCMLSGGTKNKMSCNIWFQYRAILMNFKEVKIIISRFAVCSTSERKKVENFTHLLKEKKHI